MSNPYRKGTNHPQAQLNAEQVNAIRKRADQGEPINDIAVDYRPLARSAVFRVAKRRGYLNVPEYPGSPFSGRIIPKVRSI